MIDHTSFYSGSALMALLTGGPQEAAIVVMPSLGEGYGLPVLEALASGKPVLASRGIPRAGFTSLLSPEVVQRLETFDPLDAFELSALLDRSLFCDTPPTLSHRSTPSSTRLDPEQIWRNYTRELFHFSFASKDDTGPERRTSTG